MFTRKINYLWAINLILFVGVVFLGIEQASRGADISMLEDRYEKISIERRDLTENIFKNGSEDKILSFTNNFGFSKPSKVLYFNSIDSVASTR